MADSTFPTLIVSLKCIRLWFRQILNTVWMRLRWTIYLCVCLMARWHRLVSSYIWHVVTVPSLWAASICSTPLQWMQCLPKGIVQVTRSVRCRRLLYKHFRKALDMISVVLLVKRLTREVLPSSFLVSASWWFTLFWALFMKVFLFHLQCCYLYHSVWWAVSCLPRWWDWKIIFICRPDWLCWLVCLPRPLSCWLSMLPSAVRQVWVWLLLPFLLPRLVCVLSWWRRWPWFSVYFRWWSPVV